MIMFAIILITSIILLQFNSKDYFTKTFIFYDENNNIINHLEIELPEQLMAMKYIKPTDVVLELGARYGTVSCTINNILNNKHNQVSVEPDSVVWEALSKNKINNACEFNILQGFISNKKLGLTGEHNYGIQSIVDTNSTISSYTLDEVETMYNLHFNVLVADCEGYLCSFLNENPKLYTQLTTIIFEADNAVICDYNNIREQLKINGFVEMEYSPYLLEPKFQNAWSKRKL